MKRAVRTTEDVERVLMANAMVLGLPQEVFLRKRPDGSFRVQSRVAGKWCRFAFKEYPTLADLTWAAQVSHDRAHAASLQVAGCEWCATHPNQGIGA